MCSSTSQLCSECATVQSGVHPKIHRLTDSLLTLLAFIPHLIKQRVEKTAAAGVTAALRAPDSGELIDVEVSLKFKLTKSIQLYQSSVEYKRLKQRSILFCLEQKLICYLHNFVKLNFSIIF